MAQQHNYISTTPDERLPPADNALSPNESAEHNSDSTRPGEPLPPAADKELSPDESEAPSPRSIKADEMLTKYAEWVLTPEEIKKVRRWKTFDNTVCASWFCCVFPLTMGYS